MNLRDFFEVEQIGRTIILTMMSNSREYVYDPDLNKKLVAEAIELLSGTRAEKIVIDLREVRYCNSYFLGLLAKLCKRVREAGGQMAFCNVCEHIQTVMMALNLSKVWAICDSRADAIAEVGK